MANVRIKQVTPAGTAWLAQVLHASAYTTFMADGVGVTFNNGERSMQGRHAVRDRLAKFWPSFGTLEHDERNIYGTEHNLVNETLNYCMTTDGREFARGLGQTATTMARPPCCASTTTRAHSGHRVAHALAAPVRGGRRGPYLSPRPRRGSSQARLSRLSAPSELATVGTSRVGASRQLHRGSPGHATTNDNDIVLMTNHE